uniref:RxLR effector protein n=2 Tax=Phytophthora ramorum TaxID=164328 RepID=H3H870_PHYRM
MRLYHVLLATAVALLASNNGFAAANECTIVTNAPETTGSSSFINDASSGSNIDTPVTQDSTAASDVGASQTSTSSDDETKKGGVDSASGSAPSSVDASQNTDVASSGSTAGEADPSVTITDAPTATTRAPT